MNATIAEIFRTVAIDDKLTHRHETVELCLNKSNRWALRSDQQIVEGFVTGVKAYHSGHMKLTPKSHAPVIQGTMFPYLYLTLTMGLQNETLHQIPFYDLSADRFQGDEQFYPLRYEFLNLHNCFVENTENSNTPHASNLTTTVVANSERLLLSFRYYHISDFSAEYQEVLNRHYKTIMR